MSKVKGSHNYSPEIRKNAINEVILNNKSVKEVAEKYNMDPATLYRWLKRYNQIDKKAYKPKKVGRAQTNKEIDYKGAYEAIMRFLVFQEKKN